MAWRSDAVEVVWGQGRTGGPSLWAGSEGHKSQNRGEVACWNPKYLGLGSWCLLKANNTEFTSFNRRHDRNTVGNIEQRKRKGYESFRTWVWRHPASLEQFIPV